MQLVSSSIAILLLLGPTLSNSVLVTVSALVKLDTSPSSP
jgi:hypothetical protein